MSKLKVAAQNALVALEDSYDFLKSRVGKGRQAYYLTRINELRAALAEPDETESLRARVAELEKKKKVVAWRRVSRITGQCTGLFETTEDVELKSEILEPLVLGDPAVAAERTKPTPIMVEAAEEIKSLRARVAELEKELADSEAALRVWHGRTERAEARVAENKNV